MEVDFGSPGLGGDITNDRIWEEYAYNLSRIKVDGGWIYIYVPVIGNRMMVFVPDPPPKSHSSLNFY